MPEFKTVVERFNNDLKRMHEGLDHRLGRVEKDITRGREPFPGDTNKITVATWSLIH